ncbi:MAG: hypothetical protein JXJ19_02395 [Elusimicrobia bacterium]|nr:hypothetical protein [Elusimicrobiota bacterium]
MKRILFAIIVILVPVSRVFPLTYLGSVDPLAIGDPVLSVTGRAVGMGNTAISSSYGGAAVFYNPANMLKARGFNVSLGFGVYPVKETIEPDSEPTWYNSANYFEFSNAGLTYPVTPGFAFGIGYRPFLDLNYSHKKKIYDSGILESDYEFERSGGFAKTTMALAAGLGQLSAGLNYDVIGNGYKDEYSLLDVENEITEGSAESTFSGYSYGAGINLELVRDIADVGIVWNSEFRVDSDWEASMDTYGWDDAWPVKPDSSFEDDGKRQYDFPQELGFGICYRFYKYEMSSFSVDIVKTYWEDFRYREKKLSDKWIDPQYRNTTRVSVGAEHYIGTHTALRYGFTHLPHYSRTTCDLTMFTLGVGFPLTRMMDADIGGIYGKRNFYGGNILFAEDEMVDERIAKIQLSFLMKF